MWTIVVSLILLLGGGGSFHDLQCAPRHSHIADDFFGEPITDNSIGEAGCIALSSSLVHLSHLKVLYIGSKFVVWSGAFVVIHWFFELILWC
jgi:hypothetical protein